MFKCSSAGASRRVQLFAGAMIAAGLMAAQVAWAGTVETPIQAGGTFKVSVTSLKERRFRETVRQQYDFSCGSAALSTLLTHHYGYPVSEQAVFTEMFQKGDRARIQRQGFSLLDIKMFLEHRGFQANGYEAPLDELTSARIPAIVLLKENGYSHFVVVKGVRDGRVLVGDPAGGTRAMSREKFDSVWANKILFIINNKMEIAKFNSDADWRVAPRAPLERGIDRNGLSGTLLQKMGPADF
jgi:predicted double-glycine peptidase